MPERVSVVPKAHIEMKTPVKTEGDESLLKDLSIEGACVHSGWRVPEGAMSK